MSSQALDRFSQSVNSQTITLNGLDAIPSAVYIQTRFYFENKSQDALFMSSHLLQESLYVALIDFPILAGNLEQTNDKWIQVAIDKNDLNLPDYKEMQSDIHFDTIKEAKYSEDVLPKNTMATAGPFVVANSENKVKLAGFHVLRLKDNSGVAIFASIVHMLVDGTGFVAFMKRWSDVCTSMSSDGGIASIPRITVTHDRLYIQHCLPKQGDSNKGVLSSGGMYIPGGMLSRWIANMTPQFRGKLFGFLMRGNSGCQYTQYYLPRTKLQALRRYVQEQPACKDLHVSDNDLIMSLLTVVSAQSLRMPRGKSLFAQMLMKLRQFIRMVFNRPPEMMGTMMMASVRPRLKRYNQQPSSLVEYCGNALVQVTVLNQLDELQTPDASKSVLAKVARSMREETNRVDEEYIREFVELHNSEPDYYLRLMLYNKKFTEQTLASNLSRMGWYDVDFGWGIPEFVTLADGPLAPLTSIMPAHPSLDGYIAHTTFSKKQDAFFKESALWTETAELIR